jgi:solute carrier family 50 protein (sugar transporter)
MSVLSLLCGLLAAALYLSPLPMVRSIARARAVGNRSVLPLTAAMLNAAVWSWYGLLTRNYVPVALVNGAGAVLEAVYIAIFLRHARKSKGRALAILAATVGAFLCALMFYVLRAAPGGAVVLGEAAAAPVLLGGGGDAFAASSSASSAFAVSGSAVLLAPAALAKSTVDPSPMASRLGNIGVLMNCFMFASPFATVAEVLKSRSAKSLPFGMILMGWLCAGSWSLYGWHELADAYIYGPNMFGFLISSLQLGLHQRYTNPLCLKYFEAASRRQKLQELSETLPNPFDAPRIRIVTNTAKESHGGQGNRLFKVKSLFGEQSSISSSVSDRFEDDASSSASSFLRV